MYFCEVIVDIFVIFYFYSYLILTLRLFVFIPDYVDDPFLMIRLQMQRFCSLLVRRFKVLPYTSQSASARMLAKLTDFDPDQQQQQQQQQQQRQSSSNKEVLKVVHSSPSQPEATNSVTTSKTSTTSEQRDDKKSNKSYNIVNKSWDEICSDLRSAVGDKGTIFV